MKENGKNVKCTLPVVGMGCAGCAARVNKTLNDVEGVVKAGVNFAASTASIEFESGVCSIEKLQKAVRDAGYDLLIEKEDEAAAHAEALREEHYKQLKTRTIGAFCLWLPMMIYWMFFSPSVIVNYAMWLFATVILFVFGQSFFVGAWQQLKHFSFNMDTLVACSTGIAYIFSVFNLLFPEFWLQNGIEPHLYFETAGGLIAFILTGRTLEERAKHNTSQAISRLVGLSPKRVTKVDKSGEKKIPISRVEVGDILAVHPGERIAVDGVVEEGSSYVDESMLSGEPVPVFKKAGDSVYAGTANKDGAFLFKAEKVGGETVLAQIIRMVKEAQGSRAPIQNVVDKIAGIFVPTILCIALLTFLGWVLFAEENGFSQGLWAMMTVLVIACPCALGLATPTAIMVGIGKGAEEGILIKGAESLQTARKIDMVVLDKTGTLTKGHPEVKHMAWSCEGERLKGVLVGLEQRSEHPLSHAVEKQFEGIDADEIQNFENIAGEGIRGEVEGKCYYAGSEKMIQHLSLEIDATLRSNADEWMKNGETIIWFTNQKEALAVISLADALKATSKEAVAELRGMGIEVCLLTGDHRSAAQAAAQEAGIQKVEAEVLPQDKARIIKKLQAEGHCVAMVGDGINDSAALATANLSIAMGHGSDVAVDTAQVTILSSDLKKISEMIILSKHTMRILHQNLFWALIYNTISVPIAAGVLYPFFKILLHPMIGGAAMACSSVSVVSNSLRLWKVKLSKR